MKPAKYLEKRYTALGLLGNMLGIWVVAMILLAFTPGVTGNSAVESRFMLGCVSVIAVISIYLLLRNYLATRLMRTRPTRLAAYAAQQHLTFESTLKKDIRSTNFRLIEQKDARIVNGLVGADWRYGELSYSIYRRVKGGEYKAAEIYYSIIELDVGRDLPNMFFDNKTAHGKQFRWKLSADQLTSLEGNFDDYFETYFPEHYEVDARSVISPEVMQAMIAISPADIEFSKNKLYLYSGLRSLDELDTFIQQAKTIRTVLVDHAMYYVDAMTDKARAKSVSVYGIRLQTKVSFPWYELCLTIIVGALSYFNTSSHKDALALMITAPFALVWFIYRLYQWDQTRHKQRQFRKRAYAAAEKRDAKYRN